MFTTSSFYLKNVLPLSIHKEQFLICCSFSRGTAIQNTWSSSTSNSGPPAISTLCWIRCGFDFLPGLLIHPIGKKAVSLFYHLFPDVVLLISFKIFSCTFIICLTVWYHISSSQPALAFDMSSSLSLFISNFWLNGRCTTLPSTWIFRGHCRVINRLNFNITFWVIVMIQSKLAPRLPCCILPHLCLSFARKSMLPLTLSYH
jgi:hypothetical protein